MFEIPSTVVLSEEFILGKISQESIFQHYLGIPIKKGLFVSPSCLRSDSKPTCSFYVDKRGRLIFKDFAGISGNCFEIVKAIYKCDYKKSLEIIASDFGIYKNNGETPKAVPISTVFKKKSESFIECEIQEFSNDDLNWWEDFGISKSTLDLYKVYCIKRVWLNDRLFATYSKNNPIYGYYFGMKNGNNLWRIYRPNQKEYRFIGNISSVIIQGLKEIPINGDYIVITKSMKDCMTLYECGVPAIAPNSENSFLNKEQYFRIKEKFNRVFLLYDNDIAGLKAAIKIRKVYPELEILRFDRDTLIKDISDYCMNYGREDTYDLINYTKKQLKLI